MSTIYEYKCECGAIVKIQTESTNVDASKLFDRIIKLHLSHKVDLPDDSMREAFNLNR